VSVAFPLSPTPAAYTQITPSQPHGVYYGAGAAVSFTLSKTGATAYTVRDYYGTLVASGAVTGTTVPVAAPTGGWSRGWYRLYLTGPTSDTLFGLAYGSTNFVILNSDTRFPTVTATTPTGGENRDLALLGMGTSRLTVGDVNNPTTGADTIAVCTADVTLSNTVWTVGSGSPYYDATRTRLLWANFPNGTSNAANVTSVVSQLYTAGITRFEGPTNEPTLNAALVTSMQNFYTAVKAANPNAVVIGPTPVQISAAAGGGLEQFLAAGGGNYIDEWAVHAYNSQTAGDLNLGRTQLGRVQDHARQVRAVRQDDLADRVDPRVLQRLRRLSPRRSRVPLLMTLQCEQHGVPRERNNYWYDWSHGFWSYPSWWQMGDGTLNPTRCCTGRWPRRRSARPTPRPWTSAPSATGSSSARSMTGASGKTASSWSKPSRTWPAPPSPRRHRHQRAAHRGRRVRQHLEPHRHRRPVVGPGQRRPHLPAAPEPAPLRLGMTCNDWPTSRDPGGSPPPPPVAATSALTSPPATSTTTLLFQYTAGRTADGVALGTTMPDTAHAHLAHRRPRRPGHHLGRLLAVHVRARRLRRPDQQRRHDLDHQGTVTKTTPSSFVHGADSTGTGCQRETYWDEQWIFDVKLPAPVTAKAVRLNVRATSYGGEPDAACVTAGGQGNAAQYITVQEIAVLCDDNTNLHVATIA
jgi:hypothetical protein